VTCCLCEATCGLEIETRGPEVVSIRGDKNDPFSRGYLCPKAMALKDIHEDPNRLRRPQKRTDRGWVEVEWEQAFDEVAAGLAQVRERHGRHSVAIYQGNPSVHSVGVLTFGQLLPAAIRTRNNYSATSADQLPHMLAALQMFGNQLRMPVPDIDHTDLLLVFGGNPLVSNGSIMTAPDLKGRLRSIRDRGGRVVVFDPRRTQTARAADEHHFVTPGTDALVLLAMLHTIFKEGLDDLGRLGPFTDGLSEVRAAASRFSPDRVAGIVGIEANDLRRVAREFARTERAACYGRIGVCTQEFGGLCAWLLNVLNAVTGHLDRRGGMMFTTPAVDIVRAASQMGRKGAFGRYRSRVRGLPEFGGELPVSSLAEDMDTPGEGQIRALVTSCGNPVLSIPNGARLERALGDLEFMVSIDIYRNETTRHANYILPPTWALERDHYDLAFYALAVRNVARYSEAVFERDPDQRHDWEIYLELATRLGLQGPIARHLRGALRATGRKVTPRGVVDLGLRLGPYGAFGFAERRGLTVKKLVQSRHGVDLGALQPRLPEALETDSGRLQLAPPVYLDDLDRLEDFATERASRAAGALSLIGRRDLRSNNSWMHNSNRLVKGKPRCTLLMNPGDAGARGLADGQRVRVDSRVGRVEAPVEVSDDIMPGVVSLPHGWGHHREGIALDVAREHAGVSVNDLTDEAYCDTLSGNACFSAVPVTVEAAE